MSLLFSVTIALVLVVLGILLAPHRPPPVVGQLLPHHDPKRRTPFRSTRRKS